MFGKIRQLMIMHVKNNVNTYFFLSLAFVVGVSAGAFTVNGLSTVQREELTNYFQGFLHLLDNQSVYGGEVLKITAMDNLKVVTLLWILGVSIIGIPFIFILVGIRGFVTGFSSGFIVKSMGVKGGIFALVGLVPKEIIIVPCIIALGVNGINFSLNIIKNKPAKQLSKENLKTSFLAYCFVTLFYTCFIFIGVMAEAYVIPILIRVAAPLITI